MDFPAVSATHISSMVLLHAACASRDPTNRRSRAIFNIEPTQRSASLRHDRCSARSLRWSYRLERYFLGIHLVRIELLRLFLRIQFIEFRGYLDRIGRLFLH